MNERPTITINTPLDVVTARMEVRNLARAVGLNTSDQARISLATSSLAEALGIGGARRGRITIERLIGDKRSGVRVICTTTQSPPDSIDSDLQSKVSGNSTWRWMVDELIVETPPSNELQVTLVKWMA